MRKRQAKKQMKKRRYTLKDSTKNSISKAIIYQTDEKHDVDGVPDYLASKKISITIDINSKTCKECSSKKSCEIGLNFKGKTRPRSCPKK